MTTTTDDFRHLIELRDSPGKDKGFFAKTVIPIGTRVLAEQGLFGIQNDGDETILDALYENGKDNPEYYNFLIRFEALPEDKREDFLRLHRFARYSPEFWTGRFFDAPPERVKLGIRVNEIKLTNWHAGGDIFLLGSRFNHSCMPNVAWVFNKDIDRMTFHAIRNIATGEELMVSYSDVHEPRERRRALLMKDYGFLCNCLICESTFDGGEKAQKFTRLATLYKEVKALLEVIDEGSAGREVFNAAILAAEEMAVIQEDEGLVSTLPNT